MRLIDVDTLKKDLKSVTLSNGTLVNTNAVLLLLDKYPTAYDVDKVVAAMDKALIELEDGTNCGTCAFKAVCDDGYDGCLQTIVAVCKSIVKKGSVSDDVCEKSEGGGVDEL